MNYEKKYKNLVAKVKNAYLYAQTDSTKAAFETIFPELAESDDERIRRGLIALVEWAQTFSASGITKEEADAMKAFLEKQKPAEWSEEDEEKLGGLINYFEGDTLNCSSKDMVAWLKSLSERFELQPKQEWSVDDEIIRDSIIEYINSGNIYATSRVNMITWLEYLRPQPHWKPTEEQMDELEKVSSGNTCAFNYGILRELYDNLKKL